MADGTRTSDAARALNSWRQDAQFSVDYSKAYLGLEYAYIRGLSGQGVTVAINDSGIYWDHPLFQGRNNGLNSGVSDELGNNGSISSTEPWHNHGTHVAGTAVGRRIAGERMFGNAFNATVYSATTHFLGSNYTATRTRLAGGDLVDSFDALYHIGTSGSARIINNSWGVGIGTRNPLRFDASLEAMERRFADFGPEIRTVDFERFLRHDPLVVMSAGNEGESHASMFNMIPHFVPEMRSNFITVTNYDGNDIQNGSNLCGHAATWCVSGPGTGIISAAPTYTFRTDDWRAAFPTNVVARNTVFMREYNRTNIFGERVGTVASAFAAYTKDQLEAYIRERTAAEAANRPFDREARLRALGEQVATFQKHTYAAYNTPGLAIGAEAFGIYEDLKAMLERETGGLSRTETLTFLDTLQTNFLEEFNRYRGPLVPGYSSKNGTSMAAPNISGFAALLLEHFPEYGTGLITDIVLSSGRDSEAPGVDIRAGWGVPQMGTALEGPRALRAVRDVNVLAGTRDVWTNNITDAIDKYSNIVLERTPDDIGGLTKIGGGELVLTGTNSYSGPTRVLGGLLTVDGALTRSAAAVADTGIISGTGRLASLVAEAGGVVAPGNSENPFGTLTVTGNATFRPDSFLWVRTGVNGTPVSKLDVLGTTTLEGGRVIVKADSGQWNLRTRDIRFLTSAGGVTGQFDGVSSDLALLTPTLTYEDNAVLLSLVRNDVPLASAGSNRNERAVGGALDVMTRTNKTGNLSLENAILDGSFDALRGSLRSLTGEIHASLGSVATADARSLRDAMLDRGRGITSGVVNEYVGHGVTFWASGNFSQGGFDGSHQQRQFRTDSTGYSAGLDKTTENAHFGVALGSNTTRLDRSKIASSAEVTTQHIGAYGGLDYQGFNIRIGGSLYQADNGTRRTAGINAFQDNLNSDYDGDGWQAYAEVSTGRQFGRANLQPYVNYTHVSYDADVKEVGGDAALSGSFSETAKLLTGGVRGEARLTGTAERPVLSLVGHVAWTENLNGDYTPTFRARFADGPAFKVRAQSLSGDFLQSQVGVNVRASTRTTLDFGYTDTRGDDFSNRRLFGRLNVAF